MSGHKMLYVPWRRLELPILSRENWAMFVAMIGESEYRIMSSDGAEDVQGCWVKNVIEISPQGRSNLERCREILGKV